MLKKNKGKLIVSSLIILLPIVIGLFLWNDMPERIATHWNVQGEPDGFSSRSFTVFVMPIILLILHWIALFFTARDPKNKEQNSKVFQMVFWIVPMISLMVCSFSYVRALGNDISMDMIGRILLAFMLIIFGNYMPKCKKNHTIGIKVVWALRNEENWNKTHRFAGNIWFFGGIVLLATILIPIEQSMYIFLVLLLVIAFAPMIYSYVYYRKQLKMGTATKEDAIMNSSERKTTKLSLAVGIIIIIFVIISLFTGKFELQFEETFFRINATYWDDATVNYADIDSIEYREENVAGTRTFGYGGSTIIMGECENSEFGSYTRYTYISCDACIVLTVDNNILVINGKNEEQTKEIYEELQKKLQFQ